MKAKYKIALMATLSTTGVEAQTSNNCFMSLKSIEKLEVSDLTDDERDILKQSIQSLEQFDFATAYEANHPQQTPSEVSATTSNPINTQVDSYLPANANSPMSYDELLRQYESLEAQSLLEEAERQRRLIEDLKKSRDSLNSIKSHNRRK